MKRLHSYHIMLWMWVVILLLGGLCLCVPTGGLVCGSWTLRWPTLNAVLGLSPQTPVGMWNAIDSIDATEGVDSIKNTTIMSASTSPTPILNFPDTVDTRQYLYLFYEALSTASNNQVRVLHYGDSQIEEDRLTMILRRHLQSKYGGGGVGLIPLHQTIPTRTLIQRLSMFGDLQPVNGGPKRYLIYGPQSMRRFDNHLYGAMGQVAILQQDAHATLSILPRSKERHSENYFSQIRLWASDSVSMCLLHDSIQYHSLMPIADSSTSITIRLLGGGDVYGLSLEMPHGLIVDNIPMRGSSGSVFHIIDSIQLSTFYSQTNTKLIILQFGGNSLPNMLSINYVRTAVNQLRKEVKYLRACAPNASILFIGPSDMLTWKDGNLITMPLLPEMDVLLSRMARQEHIAYWSLFQAMGGAGSMLTWKEKGLANSDYIHFTRAGADKAGYMLATWLEEGHNSQ